MSFSWPTIATRQRKCQLTKQPNKQICSLYSIANVFIINKHNNGVKSQKSILHTNEMLGK